jgi:hypothetical protein
MLASRRGRMKTSSLAFAIFLSFASGCGGGSGVRGDAVTDTDGTDLPSDGHDIIGPDVDADPAPDGTVSPTEATFVINAMTIPGDDIGFNLDGENTTCTSGCIPDGPDGVDNRLGAVLSAIAHSLGGGADFNIKMSQSIDSGGKLVLLRLVGITGFEDAADVDALRYDGVETDMPANPGDNFSGSEPFDISSISLAGGMTDVDNVLYRFDGGAIALGKFDAITPLFVVEIPYDSASMLLPLQNAQIHFSFDRDPDASGEHYIDGRLSDGLLGGVIALQDFAVELRHFFEDLGGGIDPETAMNIVANNADIDLIPEGPTSDSCTASPDCPLPWQMCDGGFCYEPPDRMDAISVAVQFSAVSAVFTGNIVTP